MCGICGKVVFSGETPDPALIGRMAVTLAHRGPDDEGVYTAPGVGLGQRRLSIIDLRRSATPPLANEDGTIQVVFNGEIYNFQSLRRDLEARGHTFRTNTDTEVIVHLYEQYGTGCVHHMRGMFAFALWDSNNRLLFGARDRLGKKPFCYARTPNAFLFGSEIKAIMADPEMSASPDLAAIDQYLKYQFVPSPRTAFEGVRKLPPAHWIVCHADGTVKIERYWHLPTGDPIRAPREEIEEEIVERLREAVRLRLISDVPLGAFLSGGIDSGLIVALMAQESAKPVRTFSIGFEDESHNELPYARLLAERYGTEQQEFIVRPDAAALLPLLVRHYNEPFADSSAIPTYYVSRMTRQSVTVALTGDGGDENFSGYDGYGDVARWSKVDAIPMAARAVVGRGVAAVLDRLPYNNTLARVSRGFAMLGSRLDDRYVLHARYFKPRECRALYSPLFQSYLAAAAADDPYENFEWDGATDPLSWMMRHDQSFYLPDCLMVKSDIASMANSLELRCPFLDHEFLEFAARIPSSLKRLNGTGKLILRSAARRLLPEPILTKPKTGFAIPLAKWLRDDLQGLLREMLLDDRAARRGLFNPPFVRKLIDDHATGRRDWSNRLWALLFLEMWFREFID